MDKPFFVMLFNQKGTRLVPLVDPDGQLMMYETAAEARGAAENSLMGERFGYLIYSAEEPFE